MNIGSVVAMSHCNVINGSMTFGYKARKGERLVFVFLGKEPKDGSAPVDVDKILEGMGWVYNPK